VTESDTRTGKPGTKVARATIRLMIRVAGYALSAIVALIFYVGWIAAEVGSPGGSLWDRVFAALVMCILGGFSAALLWMSLPWVLIVWTFRKVRLSGAAYFAVAGALLMIVVGCTASSLSPKLLFIEDQTFLEGVVIALERQGICFALAGAMLGLGYWFLAERRFSSPEMPLARHDTLEARS
jgi:hypothetical protein